MAAEQPPYHGYDVPWNYGRYRMVVTRRVNDDEQLSVEAYESDRATAIETFNLFLAECRAHMIAHNERVVLAHRDHLIKLERLIESRSEEIRDLDEQIAQRKAELCGYDEKQDAVN